MLDRNSVLDSELIGEASKLTKGTAAVLLWLFGSHQGAHDTGALHITYA